MQLVCPPKRRDRGRRRRTATSRVACAFVFACERAARPNRPAGRRMRRSNVVDEPRVNGG
jgi:hypothetical protein